MQRDVILIVFLCIRRSAHTVRSTSLHKGLTLIIFRETSGRRIICLAAGVFLYAFGSAVTSAPFALVTAACAVVQRLRAGLGQLGRRLPILLEEAVQGVPDPFQALVFPPIDDVPDVLTEL